MEGIHGGWNQKFFKGSKQGIWGQKSPSGIKGTAPVGSLGDEVREDVVPQKLKQNVNLVYNV